MLSLSFINLEKPTTPFILAILQPTYSLLRIQFLYITLYLQVNVVDRTAVITANAEIVVLKPVGIQEAINAETGKFIQWYIKNLSCSVHGI